jgi:hypothetical protein
VHLGFVGAVGPSSCEETVNSKRYFPMLHESIGLLEEDETTYSWFQQDGATAHTANNSIELLNDVFWNVLPLETYGPLSRLILLHQTFIRGEQQTAVYHDRPRTLMS